MGLMFEKFRLINLDDTPPLSQQIIELIRSRGPTPISEVVSATGANRNTVKVHFRRLVDDGHLVAEAVGRGVRYRMSV